MKYIYIFQNRTESVGWKWKISNLLDDIVSSEREKLRGTKVKHTALKA